MDEKEKGSSCKGSCCGGGCRCMKVVILVLLFLVGVIIGFLMGHHHGRWHKKMMMGHGGPMGQMSGPQAPPES